MGLWLYKVAVPPALPVDGARGDNCTHTPISLLIIVGSWEFSSKPTPESLFCLCPFCTCTILLQGQKTGSQLQHVFSCQPPTSSHYTCTPVVIASSHLTSHPTGALTGPAGLPPLPHHVDAFLSPLSACCSTHALPQPIQALTPVLGNPPCPRDTLYPASLLSLLNNPSNHAYFVQLHPMSLLEEKGKR